MNSSLPTHSRIADVISSWTNENPKKPNPGPNEPVLLVKPKYFEGVRTAGLAVVKALYGRGKTYGFGLNLYHTARVRGDQEVVYINAREVRDKVINTLEIVGSEKIAELKRLILTGDARDIIRLICAGHFLHDIVNASDGTYLATTMDPIRTCHNFASYLDKEPSVGLREFLRDIAKSSPRRLVVVIDEFEQMTTTAGGRPNTQYVYNLIETLIKSLRPGVLDELPGKFGIVLLIQELYYPSDRMRDLMSHGAYAAIGRMYSVYDDGSIPVIYTIDSYYDYIKEVTLNLKNLKYIDKDLADEIILVFNDYNIKRLLKEYLPNMPAMIAFNILQQLYLKALSNTAPEAIRDEFISLIENYSAYGIYGGRREVAKGSYLANALAGLLGDYYRGTTIPTKVERIGYEGAYSVTENEVKILIARLGDVKDEKTYLNEFKKLYGNILKTYCVRKSQQKTHIPTCELILLYQDGVRVGPAELAIKSLLKGGIDGINISFTYKIRKITNDDLFVMITRYNNVSILAGDRRYVNSPERIQSLINKVFS